MATPPTIFIPIIAGSAYSYRQPAMDLKQKKAAHSSSFFCL